MHESASLAVDSVGFRLLSIPKSIRDMVVHGKFETFICCFDAVGSKNNNERIQFIGGQDLWCLCRFLGHTPEKTLVEHAFVSAGSHLHITHLRRLRLRHQTSDFR